jgi:hypothetical protein
MADEKAGSRSYVYTMAIMLLMAIVVLPFLPMLAAVLEYAVFGTHAVELFFTRLGMDDALSALYQACGIN